MIWLKFPTRQGGFNNFSLFCFMRFFFLFFHICAFVQFIFILFYFFTIFIVRLDSYYDYFSCLSFISLVYLYRSKCDFIFVEKLYESIKKSNDVQFYLKCSFLFVHVHFVFSVSEIWKLFLTMIWNQSYRQF